MPRITTTTSSSSGRSTGAQAVDIEYELDLEPAQGSTRGRR
jgi:hypothetical protein